MSLSHSWTVARRGLSSPPRPLHHLPLLQAAGPSSLAHLLPQATHAATRLACFSTQPLHHHGPRPILSNFNAAPCRRPASFRNFAGSAPRLAVPPSSRLDPLAPSTAATITTMATPPSDRRPIVISGPSGVGKGTLFKSLFERHPDTFTLTVSHTTRDPRPGEQRGVDYHYVSRDEFAALVAEGGFVEHAQFGSNLYGTSKAAIAAEQGKGKIVVLDIEMEGVKQVRASDLDTRRVFIAPPPAGGEDASAQLATLEGRLRGRGTETEDSIRRRLDRASEELEFGRNSGAFDHIIVNDNLQAAIQELDDWVYGVSGAGAQ